MSSYAKTFIEYNEFYKKYKEDLFKSLKLIYPERNDEELLKEIDDKTRERFKDKEVRIENTKEKTKIKSTLSMQLDMIEREKPTLTGNGFLMRHDEFVVEKMLKHLLALRGEYKDEMLEFVNTNPQKSKRLNQWQNTIKELTNSYYGAMGEVNSQFFDKFLVTAVTLSGQNVISTAVIAYESFFGNASLESINDLILYVRRVLEECKDFSEDDFLIDVIDDMEIEDEELINHLFSIIPYEKKNEENKKIINLLIKDLSYIERFTLLMKNNFFKFIEVPYVKEMMSEIVDFDYKNYDKFLSMFKKSDNDKLKEKDYSKEEMNAYYLISDLWYVVEKFVAFYHNANNPKWKINNEKRNTILVVDKTLLTVNLFNCWETLRAS